MSKLLTLISREIQEYKYGLVYAPWIVGIILCSIVVLVYLGFAEIKTSQFTFTSLIYADPDVVTYMKTIDSNTKLEIIRTGLIVLGLPMLVVMSFAIASYSLSTFYDERKDKSIIFWRSLPVSDANIIFSKILVAVIIAPLVVLPALVALHLFSLLAVSIFFYFSNIVSFGWVWEAYSFTDWMKVILSLWVQGLWSLPIIAWLMFAGALFKKPIIGAILPLVSIVVLERVALSTNIFYSNFMDRLKPWPNMVSSSEEVRFIQLPEITDLFSTSIFWYGLIFSVILCAAINYVRSRSEFSSVE
jgi:ABC-2 type transport system permease protein